MDRTAKQVIDVKEANLTSTNPATIKRNLYGLLYEKKFWDQMAAENDRITVGLFGIFRGDRYIAQLVVTEQLKPLPHEVD